MDEDKQKNSSVVAEAVVVPLGLKPDEQKSFTNKPVRNQGRFGDRRGGGRRSPKRDDRVREFDQKILNIRRVTRVAAGGRRFSFSVAMVIGNRKGSVGVGIGKAGDTALAIDKATRDAKRHLVKINRTKTFSIAHEVEAKYSSARVFIRPAKGRGLIAGSSVRDVLDLSGVNGVSAKIFSGSKNRLNIAQAAVRALSQLAEVKTDKPVLK